MYHGAISHLFSELFEHFKRIEISKKLKYFKNIDLKKKLYLKNLEKSEKKEKLHLNTHKYTTIYKEAEY